jgi:hypothetical protein
MFKYKNFIFLTTLIVFMFGCASLPIDTLNKRIAVFEISYGEVLVTVDRWIVEKRLVNEDKAKVQAMIKEVQVARTAMYIAKDAGEIANAQDNLTAANIILSKLRDYVATQEAKQNE